MADEQADQGIALRVPSEDADRFASGVPVATPTDSPAGSAPARKPARKRAAKKTAAKKAAATSGQQAAPTEEK